MDGQLSFATLDYAGKKKRTKRDAKQILEVVRQVSTGNANAKRKAAGGKGKVTVDGVVYDIVMKGPMVGVTFRF